MYQNQLGIIPSVKDDLQKNQKVQENNSRL